MSQRIVLLEPPYVFWDRAMDRIRDGEGEVTLGDAFPLRFGPSIANYRCTPVATLVTPLPATTPVGTLPRPSIQAPAAP